MAWVKTVTGNLGATVALTDPKPEERVAEILVETRVNRTGRGKACGADSPLRGRGRGRARTTRRGYEPTGGYVQLSRSPVFGFRYPNKAPFSKFVSATLNVTRKKAGLLTKTMWEDTARCATIITEPTTKNSMATRGNGTEEDHHRLTEVEDTTRIAITTTATARIEGRVPNGGIVEWSLQSPLPERYSALMWQL